MLSVLEYCIKRAASSPHVVCVGEYYSSCLGYISHTTLFAGNTNYKYIYLEASETLPLGRKNCPLVKQVIIILYYFPPFYYLEDYFSGYHTHIMRGVCVRASSSSSSRVLSKTHRQEVSLVGNVLQAFSSLFRSPPLLLPLEHSNSALLFQLPSDRLWSCWTFPDLYPDTTTQSSPLNLNKPRHNLYWKHWILYLNQMLLYSSKVK